MTVAELKKVIEGYPESARVHLIDADANFLELEHGEFKFSDSSVDTSSFVLRIVKC